MPEELRQFGVDALCNVPIPRHQIFRFVVEETGIGAQVRRELVEGPLEASRGHDLVHLRADPFHLGQAEGMDLFGREIRRGVNAQEIRIDRPAVGQGAHGDRLSGMRDVRRGEIVVQLVKGRHVLRPIDLHRGSSKPFSLRRWNGLRDPRERLEHLTLERVIGDEAQHVLGDMAESDSRRSESELQPLIETCNSLIDHAGETAQARQHVLVIGNRQRGHVAEKA